MNRKYTSLPYTEYTVATGNYDQSRNPIDTIVLHHTATTYQTAIDWFGNPKAGTSAHYIVSNKGDLAAMLEEYYTAYHCGQYAVNQKSIGIETEWYEGMGDRTDALYEKVSALVADICKFYSIPIDTDHIKPHKAYFNTACPGTLDIPRIIDRAKAINMPADPCASLKAENDSLKKQLDQASMLTQENSTLKATLLSAQAEIKDRTERLNQVTAERDRLRDRIARAQVALS